MTGPVAPKEYGTVRVCAWNGPLFMSVFIVFWGIMGHNLPPYSSSLPAADIAAYFRDNAAQVRAGMAVAMTFAVSYAVWGLAIAKVMEHVVHKDSILIDLQKWGAGLTVVPVLVSCSFWMAGAFRPEVHTDETLQMMYDMAWLLIDLAYSVTSVQMIALGVAFIKDRRDVPLVPKWVAWYGIWVAFMFIAECLMPQFRSGAFERAGLLNFWIEFLIWFIWCPLLTIYILKAINRIEQEQTAA